MKKSNKGARRRNRDRRQREAVERQARYDRWIDSSLESMPIGLLVPFFEADLSPSQRERVRNKYEGRINGHAAEVKA